MELTLQIDPDVKEWLDHIVEEYGHNHAYWLLELARIGREDLEDLLAADRAWAEMRIKGEKPLSSEEMERELGLAD